MSRIAMLLSNPFRPDPRVLKEAGSLTNLGHQVSILGWDRAGELPPQETLPSGVTVQRIQGIPSAYGIGARQLLRLPRFWQALQPRLDEFNPDLVHCHDFDTLPAGLRWGWRRQRPVVYDAHEYYADLCKPRLHGLSGALLYQAIRFSERFGARLASAVITVDETLAAIYRRLNHRVVVIGHYPSRDWVARPAPIFSRPTFTLLYMGRLSEDRGSLYYLDLLRHLRRLGAPARLLLAGSFTPAAQKDLFDAHAQDLAESVEWLPWLPYERVPALLETADVGLAVLQPEPRYVAALPVKLFEYMAAGLPVLASDFPPIAAVNAQAQCAVLVDPLQPASRAAQLLFEWFQNPQIPQALGCNGRKAVMETYHWEGLMAQLDQLYQALLPG
ncbi:MAG: glycosyltransferase family 4 protein [Chloroflexi bacterium]|nr:glycosyltransferase family 4 protein [Chloroflexota bacterium]